MTNNSDSGNGNPAAQAAQDEAGQVAGKAQDAAREVTDTAREEARQVAGEATEHIKSLGASAQDELFSQASTQQKRLAEQSRTVTDDIHRISRGERPQSDLVAKFVSMAAQRAEDFTTQLENKEPKDLLNDVRRFAARRPGAFLAIAAGVGLVAGRLTRGLSDGDDDEDEDQAVSSTPRQQLRTTYRENTTPATPAAADSGLAGLTPENTPGDTLDTRGKHHLTGDPDVSLEGYLPESAVIDPEERR